MTEISGDSTPTKELRIGLVLYGGVSLGVYINGVVTEIWNALRASRGVKTDDCQPGGRTANVYEALLEELGNAGGTERLQIVVDTVAGTSAGGISGAALAKAIAHGGDLRKLGTTWIEDADIKKLKACPPKRLGPGTRLLLDLLSCTVGALRRIRCAIECLPNITWHWASNQAYSLWKSKDGKRSPLDGGYFTRMLTRTLHGMDRSGPKLVSEHQRFDLYLTQTDFYGWRRHLPVSRLFHPKPLYEPAHAHAMTFSAQRYSSEDDYPLTFATRATAGFPIAFSPANHSSVWKDYAAAAKCADRAPPYDDLVAEHLREHQLAGDGEYDPRYTWMIDGGVLDNKPFELVAKAIERKPAARQVYRTVIYVEPDPHVAPRDATCRPPGVKDVAGGLYRLFRHEPIYADLRRHRERNAAVARIREIADAARKDAERAAKEVEPKCEGAGTCAPKHLHDWRCATNDALRRQRDPAYPGYVALKSRRSAGVLADIMCQALNYPEHSRQAYFVRTLVRVWMRELRRTDPPWFVDECQAYVFPDGQRELLHAFDLPFRRRRLRALVNAANRVYGCWNENLRGQLDGFKCRLAGASTRLDDLEEEARQKIGCCLKELICCRNIDEEIHKLQNPCGLFAEYHCALEEIYKNVASTLECGCSEVNRSIVAAIQNIEDETTRERIVEEYVSFPFIDRVVFPLMDSAKIEDLIEIDVLRVSPLDTDLLASIDDPLQGDELAAFAGFLKRRWRANDLLWGRLNAAERLVDVIARAAVADEHQYNSKRTQSLRKKYKIKVMEAVLEDEARRPRTSIGRVSRRVKRELEASACGGHACRSTSCTVAESLTDPSPIWANVPEEGRKPRSTPADRGTQMIAANRSCPEPNQSAGESGARAPRPEVSLPLSPAARPSFATTATQGQDRRHYMEGVR